MSYELADARLAHALDDLRNAVLAVEADAGPGRRRVRLRTRLRVSLPAEWPTPIRCRGTEVSARKTWQRPYARFVSGLRVELLSDDPDLWGCDVDDERYALIAKV